MRPVVALIPGNADPATAFAAISGHLDSVRDLADFELVELGPAAFRRTGVPLPDEVLATLRAADAIVVATPPNPGPGDTDIAPGVLEHGIVFALRTQLGLAVNVRRFVGGGATAGLDITVVRENSEGAYFTPGEVVHAGGPGEAAVQTVRTSRDAVERSVRHAFALASEGRRELVVAHKARVLTASGGVWIRAAEHVATEFPDVSWHLESIDTCCGRLVADPAAYAVIVTDNVFGDILADVVSARLAAGEYSVSAELSANPTGPSLFEPMHDTHSSEREHEALSHLGLAAAFGAALEHVGLVERGRAIRDQVEAEVARHHAQQQPGARDPGARGANTVSHDREEQHAQQ
jgi:3-isopropylmalate dehydrogenase